jgi:hypothetical protein
MSMKVIDGKEVKNLTVTKKMSDLDRGEVCYMEDCGYIMRVGLGKESLFLILNNDITCDHYDMQASHHNTVRELYEGESITINFS